MASRLKAFVIGLATLSLIGTLFAAPGSTTPDEDERRVVPIHGNAIGDGLSLYVEVFYARGGIPGPPPGHGHGKPRDVDCPDDNTQTGFAPPFAFASPLTMHIHGETVPPGLNDVDAALETAANAWNAAGAQLALVTDGSTTGPARDKTSTIGWTHLAPSNVLAATWTYVDNESGHVVEADIFFNTAQPWANLTACRIDPKGDFDVANIATHEIGHALGLLHYSDPGADATMFPTAWAGELQKTTLTAGDITALHDALAGSSP